jgi:hypothetical protein
MAHTGPDVPAFESEACQRHARLTERFRTINMILPVVTAANNQGHSTLNPSHGSGPESLRDIFSKDQHHPAISLSAIATLLVRNGEVVAVTTLHSAPLVREFGVVSSESTPNSRRQKDEGHDGEVVTGEGGNNAGHIPGEHSDDLDLDLGQVNGLPLELGPGFVTFANASSRDGYFEDQSDKVREVNLGTSHWPMVCHLSPNSILKKIE